MAAKPPPKLPPKLPPKASKVKSPPKTPAVPAKNFSIKSWGTTNDGEKIMIVGSSGRGKTTLASLAPNPVFIGLDDGGRKLKHPVTGEALKHVPGVDNFWDVRSVLQQPEVFDGIDTVVIDTITVLQDWAEPYTFATVPTQKGKTVDNLEGYGWGKGYKHLYDSMKMILQDLDALVRRGKNIILIAQNKAIKVPNPGGEDFLCDGPNLSSRDPSIRDLYCEWADHILRIDYLNKTVEDRKVSGTTERAVFVQPEPYFTAKSRTVSEPIVSFETQQDDSIWQFIFGEK